LAARTAIEALSRPPSPSDLDQLAQILADAVESGASVSFMHPFSVDAARAWWRSAIERADSRAVILVARDDSGIVGTVSLHPAWPPNQPHRADIAKLLVHRRARRRGVARALMDAIEERAHAAGFTLLTLDTVRGDAADHLYAAAGWQRVGIIPNYALYPDGRLCDVALFYKKLATEPGTAQQSSPPLSRRAGTPRGADST
jgi:GNAT superfamily N-acetyltransferase